MNTTITKLIGEIVRTNPDPSRLIHLIVRILKKNILFKLEYLMKGIASWKSISTVDQLDVHGEDIFYKISKNDRKDETLLEPNHTEFIFIDDGSELQFRARFERAISTPSFSFQTTTINKQPSSQIPIDDDDKGTSSAVPVVLLVIEGDLDTVQQG
jgi:hypothetical protein